MISYYTVWYRIISHYIVPYRIISYYNLLYCIISCKPQNIQKWFTKRINESQQNNKHNSENTQFVWKNVASPLGRCPPRAHTAGPEPIRPVPEPTRPMALAVWARNPQKWPPEPIQPVLQTGIWRLAWMSNKPWKQRKSTHLQGLRTFREPIRPISRAHAANEAE